MVTVEDVYLSYQKARGRFLNRGYRIPKDMSKIWSKLNEKAVYNLEMISKAFSTRWMNVDVDGYFDCGFELFGKGFLYHHFYDRRILLLYIEKDKQLKRTNMNVNEGYNRSKEFIESWMKDKSYRADLSFYKQYCMMMDDGIRAPINHYLKNRIEGYMMVWLIKERFLALEDNEAALVPYIMEKYRKMSYDLEHAMEDGDECKA